MKPKLTEHSSTNESQQNNSSLAKVKKVQFLGDTAIIIIDSFLTKQLGIDNQTYFKEEITPDGSIVLRIEPIEKPPAGRSSEAADRQKTVRGLC
jgi:hypothetical protein